MNRNPVTSVLVKPSGPDCNLACGYCFYRDKQQMFAATKTRMSDEVLETMIAQLMAQPISSISIGWQGGEPTLMGLPFYRRAVKWMEQYGHGQNVANSIQTNGYLIDRQWVEFFRDYHFLVGLSIDGPEHIHNQYRKTKSGASSFQQAMEAARMLLDAGVEVNVLSVLNDYSIQFPDEIYEFHKVNGLNFMQFIPCVETDPNDALKIASYSVNSEDYGHFLCRLFDLWMADFSIAGVPKTSIRFFESLLFQYAGFSATECTFLPVCGEYLVVEHNGDVYPCDFFVESKWKAGNILEIPIVDLFNSRNQSDFGRLKTKLPIDCHICKWKTLCHGGCTKDRLHHPTTRNSNYLCKAYKTFFPYADSRLSRLAEEWKKGNEFKF